MVRGVYGLPYLYNHFDYEHCKDVFNITFKAVDDAEYVHKWTHTFRHLFSCKYPPKLILSTMNPLSEILGDDYVTDDMGGVGRWF